MLHLHQIQRQHERLQQFAIDVANAILADVRFLRWMETTTREVVLRTLVEQEDQRQRKAVKTFLSACSARGIKIRVDDEGKFKVNDAKALEKNADLRAVFLIYRENIWAHLAKERDEAKLAKRA